MPGAEPNRKLLTNAVVMIETELTAYEPVVTWTMSDHARIVLVPPAHDLHIAWNRPCELTVTFTDGTQLRCAVRPTASDEQAQRC